MEEFEATDEDLAALEPGEDEHIPAVAASTYAKLADAFGRSYYRDVADEVAAEFSDVDRILDVGTGPGILALELAKRLPSTRVDAFDYTTELVRYGRAKAVETDLDDQVSFFVADAYSTPVADGTYPFLTCTGVLHTLEEPGQALAEFHRVLEPGGVAWVFDPAILDVPEEPDVGFTASEQEIFDAYGVRRDDEQPAITLSDAEALAAESPFAAAEVTRGMEGDVRLYLTNGR